MLISLSCPEVAIKGGNRRAFEDRLISNIRHALSGAGEIAVLRRPGRLLVESSDPEACKDALLRTFGIETIAFCEKTEPDMAAIAETVRSRMGELEGLSVRVETKRSDKSFPLTSIEINREIGSILSEGGCRIDLENPQKTVHVDILREEALVSFGRLKGPGGLPAGSSGKVLSLLSGGIDSPVSSWMMMRRGCSVSLLHVHQQRSGAEAMASKIGRIVRTLGSWSPRKMTVHVAPYGPFYSATMDCDQRAELVLFRRFLFHLSNALAAENGYLGVASGDSIGQVASQTLQNIFAADEASRIPVYRPLAGMNKQDIVDIAGRINTFNDSIEPYKDCCSLLSGASPSTGVPMEDVRAAEERIGIEALVRKTLLATETMDI